MYKFNQYRGILKFLVLFITMYTCCYAVIGLSSPANFYLPFVQKHLDFISVLRNFTLKGAQLLLQLFHVNSKIGRYTIQAYPGNTVRMVYSCVGYGLLSFWWSYIISIPLKNIQKSILLVGGSLFIITCNIIRISLLAYPICINNLNKNIEHHQLFNTIIYTLLFIMTIAVARFTEKQKLGS